MLWHLIFFNSQVQCLIGGDVYCRATLIKGRHLLKSVLQRQHFDCTILFDSIEYFVYARTKECEDFEVRTV